MSFARARVHILAAAALAAAPVLGEDPPVIRVGEPFPEISLPLLEAAPDGERGSSETRDLRSLASFRGHKLMLHIFASW